MDVKELKLEELRIGNLVNDNIVVDAIDFEGINGYYDEGLGGMNYEEYGCYEKDLKPIPITREHLDRAGFTTHQLRTCIRAHNSDFNMSLFKNAGLKVAYKGKGVRTIRYVHELQNLMFSMTGKELTV